ncbi:hypothetical protein LXL04_039524 [Taraxacum kok-saghyz]
MVDANASNPDLPQYSDDQFLRAFTAFKEIEKRPSMKKFTNISWKLLRFLISLKAMKALKTDRLSTEELEPEPIRPVPVPEPPFRPVPVPGTRNDHYPYDELQLKLMRMNFAFHNDQLPQNLMTFLSWSLTQEDTDKFVEEVKKRKKREQESTKDDDDDDEEEEEKPAE